MTLFRHHRGTLADSMETVVEVNSFDELVKILQDTYNKIFKDAVMPDGSNVEIHHAGFDDRVKWETYYVCVSGRCVGMTIGIIH